MLTIFLLIVSCSSLNQTSSEKEFEVISFQQGKMEQESKAWKISEEGANYIYKENGTCKFYGQIKPCMWFGFVLKYKTNQEKVVLKCSLNTTATVDFGNPNEKLSQKTDSFNFELELEGNTDELINPQYIIDNQSTETTVDKTVCKYKGKEILSFTNKFEFQKPAN